jgi:hypothetical protein
MGVGVTECVGDEHPHHADHNESAQCQDGQFAHEHEHKESFQYRLHGISVPVQYSMILLVGLGMKIEPLPWA